MAFFVFLETDILEPPRREPLGAETREDALEEAAAVLALRPHALKAHVFEDATAVGTVHRP
ncbi:hypothetical protein [Brevundimonas sp. GCM10030266]|uniref:hypothetical protein n=1 Tax=Brevundimonas sp. GCM10030266 TaxID=3273386 RepID=UPI00360A528C